MVSISNFKGTVDNGINRFSVDCSLMELKKRELTLLIGPNGSGKSVFSKLLASKKSISGNIVDSDGNNLQSRDIAYFSGEELKLLSDYHTVYEHLAVSARKELGCVSFLKSRNNYNKVIKKYKDFLSTDIQSKLNMPISKFSSGQKQLILMLLMINHNVKLLIADEPTAHLDAIWAKKIFNKLKTIALNKNIPILLITHDLTSIAPIIKNNFTYIADKGIISHWGDIKPSEISNDAQYMIKIIGETDV